MIRNIVDIRSQPITMQRQLILDILREAEEHVDAKELYRQASLRDPKISMATVYRSLRLFKEMGLIDERRLGQVRCYYEIKRSDEHQHMICISCGQVTEVESPLVQRLVTELQHKRKFHVTKAELYLEGYCDKCDEREK